MRPSIMEFCIMLLYLNCKSMTTGKLMAERRVTKTRSIFGFLVALYAAITCTIAADTLSANQTIRYHETIVSPQETFELGFFSPGNSMKHYVGIWYKKIPIQTVVWVANRNTPLTDTSGELTLTLNGVLSLRDATTGNVLWSTENSSRTSASYPIGQLLDTGNFLIYEEGDISQENPIWQSFDFPTDTLLPGMKLGKDLVTGFETRLTSWKAEDDPAFGEFSYSINTQGYPQLVITNRPEIINFRGGPWNGLGFTENPYLRPDNISNFTFILNEREIYFNYNLMNDSVLMRMLLQPSGRIQNFLWMDSKQHWILHLSQPSDKCDRYALCGPLGRCNIESSQVCECLKGFEPTSPEQWMVSDWSQGCGHNFLYCGPGEEFIKYSNLKLPDTQRSWYNQTMTLVECEKMCKNNCSCTAYTNLNLSGTGSGCLLWFGDLIDIKSYAENRDTLYIRVPPPDLDSIVNRQNSSAIGTRLRVMIPIAFVVSIILLSICLFYRFYRKKKHQQGRKAEVKEMSDWEYLSVVAARRAAASRFTQNSEGPVDLSTYVDRADYPIDADIEYELHWDKRGRLVPKVPKWAQEEYASRAITPANGRKQDQPTSASQATASASASSGTKALKHPLVEDSSATNPCGTEALKRPCVEHPLGTDNHSSLAGKLDHPNSASEATTADTESEVRSWASIKEAFAQLYPAEMGLFQEGDLVVERPKSRYGPIITPGLPSELKTRFVFPKRPLKEGAGADDVK